MNDLIEALQIMLKHGDVTHPTFCEHDKLHVYPNNMDFTDAELERLYHLGFYPDDCGFYSYRFGSN